MVSLSKALALTIGALLLLSCGVERPGDSGRAHARSPSPAAAGSQSATPSSVAVPGVVGKSVKEARNHLARLGLRSRIGGGMPSACFPPNAVLTQEPLAGSTADRGSVVRLAVNRPVPWQCGLGLPPASPELQRIADRFVDFARNAQAAGATGLPADAPVDLFIGGRFVKRLTSEQQEHRRHWQGCPREIGYAGRSCPVSVLEPFLESPGAIARTSQEPRHACAHPRALPERLGAYRQVALTADEMRDCASYFAIQLFVNDLGQIVAVNLVLSEP